jgi:hypothetical protein
MGADLDRHATGDLGHRLQQRQRAVVGGDGLVGDASCAGRDQAPGLVRIGRQMEVGEENMARLEQGDFRRLRLLDLDDHVGRGEHVCGAAGDPGAGSDIILVRKVDALARMSLDHHFVAGGD